MSFVESVECLRTGIKLGSNKRFKPCKAIGAFGSVAASYGRTGVEEIPEVVDDWLLMFTHISVYSKMLPAVVNPFCLLLRYCYGRLQGGDKF